jgi:hypothetical protein
MLFREITAVYCENHTERTNTLCRQNAEFLYIKACGTYSYHCDQDVLSHQVLLLSHSPCGHQQILPSTLSAFWWTPGFVISRTKQNFIHVSWPSYKMLKPRQGYQRNLSLQYYRAIIGTDVKKLPGYDVNFDPASGFNSFLTLGRSRVRFPLKASDCGLLHTLTTPR